MSFSMKAPSRLVVAAALCLSGCFGPTFEGKYTDEGGNGIEFTKAGDIFLYRGGQQEVSGRWSRLDDGRVTLRFDGLGSLLGTQVCNAKFEGSDLVFTNCQLAGRLKRSA